MITGSSHVLNSPFTLCRLLKGDRLLILYRHALVIEDTLPLQLWPHLQSEIVLIFSINLISLFESGRVLDHHSSVLTLNSSHSLGRTGPCRTLVYLL